MSESNMTAARSPSLLNRPRVKSGIDGSTSQHALGGVVRETKPATFKDSAKAIPALRQSSICSISNDASNR